MSYNLVSHASSNPDIYFWSLTHLRWKSSILCNQEFILSPERGMSRKCRRSSDLNHMSYVQCLRWSLEFMNQAHCLCWSWDCNTRLWNALRCSYKRTNYRSPKITVSTSVRWTEDCQPKLCSFIVPLMNSSECKRSIPVSIDWMQLWFNLLKLSACSSLKP